MEEALYFGEQENVVYLRVKGHMTARICGSLRNRASKRFASFPLPAEFFVDLRDCSYMDSTFIGLLVSMNKSMKKASGCGLTLLGPNETCRKLLAGLGVESLFIIRQESVSMPSEMFNLAESEEATPELLLHTHEELMQAFPANRAKFAGLQEVLKAAMKASHRT